MNKKSAAVLILVLAVACPSLAGYVDLTKNGLGLATGNYGATLTINDHVQVSALSGIKTGFDDSKAGTVYLNGNYGLGVKNKSKKGSADISGSGSDQDEALVLDFSYVLTNSLLVGLNSYTKNGDDPIIKAVLANGQEYIFNESSKKWLDSVTSIGCEKILVNVGSLLASQGVSSNELVDRLYIKETSGHLYVNSLSYQVPEPATALMFGVGLLLAGYKKKLKTSK